ncbi:hypothetical protein TNCT_105371 [Trichonephila clavata]|uniref:Uncharacterized protein n=1 Tax=Trichonephila clavata TaxID=2740835 RepID=A0A8X6GVH8_TRICU|nr:hypothetical protein TNCT_105371 [Trichonephila clavata]
MAFRSYVMEIFKSPCFQIRVWDERIIETSLRSSSKNVYDIFNHNTTGFLQQGERERGGNPIFSFHGTGKGFESLGALRRDTANHIAAL